MAVDAQDYFDMLKAQLKSFCAILNRSTVYVEDSYGASKEIEVNVHEGNLALIFGCREAAGKVVRVLWPHDVTDQYGHRWVVRLGDEGDCIIPNISLMMLDVDPRKDPGARDLLDDDGKAAWDRWFSPPEIDF